MVWLHIENNRNSRKEIQQIIVRYVNATDEKSNTCKKGHNICDLTIKYGNTKIIWCTIIFCLKTNIKREQKMKGFKNWPK